MTCGPGASHTANGVTAVASARPVASCDCGHDAVLDAADAVTAVFQERLPIAATRWLRKPACAVCRSKLTLPARWTQVPVTVEQPLLFTVTLDVPAVRCPSCGRDQLPRYARTDCDAAIRGLFTG